MPRAPAKSKAMAATAATAKVGSAVANVGKALAKVGSIADRAARSAAAYRSHAGGDGQVAAQAGPEQSGRGQGPGGDEALHRNARQHRRDVRDAPIPGGVYKMGSPASEKDRKADEGPQVEVKIEPFWMGRHEVTWG